MTEQPEALRLADALDGYATGDKFQRPTEEAAAELRRLYTLATDQHSEIYGLNAKVRRLDALCDELLEALKNINHYAECTVAVFSSGRAHLDLTLFPRLCSAAHAAIAKAEGETK